MNLARLHEAISELIPDNECLVCGGNRYTYADVTGRTRRLASVLRAHGLGIREERDKLENWESGQDHIALYLYNGNEYLEGMLGAYKCRTAPFNVNYRYVEDELLYLFDNADAKAIIFHAQFAPVLEKIRHKLRGVKLLLQVSDDSGNALLEGALDYEQAIAEAEPEPMDEAASPDDLYVIYTGGTTGMPKGVLWRQEDIFFSAISRSEEKITEEEYVKRLVRELERKNPPRGLPLPPYMHASAQWIAFGLWSMGGTVFCQQNVTRLDPEDVWSTVEGERIGSINIIGDAFAVPLLDELERHEYDLSSMRLISSGGAIFSAANKEKFREFMPQLVIVDVLGSSESGTQASQLSQPGKKATTGDFSPKAGCVVLNEELSCVLSTDSAERGWLARTGYVPLGYYKDETKTLKTFPVIDGTRYSVPGDRSFYDEKGEIQLLGRDSVCINTGGEKVFAEEVELALKHHDAVYDVIVCPTPSERWGQQVTAIIRLREGRHASDTELREFARQHIADYKLPKVFLYVDHIQRAPNGKPDYAWARATAGEMLARQQQSKQSSQ